MVISLSFSLCVRPTQSAPLEKITISLLNRPHPNLFPASATIHTDIHDRKRAVSLETQWRWTLTSHWKGFSPVWVLMCSSSPRFWLKALLHSLHLYGFSCSKIHTSFKESRGTTKQKAAHPWFDHIWRKPGERFTSTMVYIITHMCACRKIYNTVGVNFNETANYSFFKTQACPACQFREIQNEKLYNSSGVKVLKNTWNLQNGKENIAVKKTFENISVQWHSVAVIYHFSVTTPHQFTKEHFLWAFWRSDSVSVKTAS